MYIQNNIVEEFISWANRNVLDKKDRIRIKFNESKEDESLGSKIKFFRGRPKAVITLSNQIPFLEIPSYIIIQLAKYMIYKENSFIFPKKEELEDEKVLEQIEIIANRWNDFVDTKYSIESERNS